MCDELQEVHQKQWPQSVIKGPVWREQPPAT